MNLIPWRNKRHDSMAESGMTSLVRFRDEFDRLFDRFLGSMADPIWPAPMGGVWGWGPRVDLSETDDQVEVRMELPGVNPEDLQLDVVGNNLNVRGEKRSDREEKHRNYYYAEREYGTFSRTIPLPADVDSEKVDARFKDGVLTVSLAKKAEAHGRKIKVRHA